MNEAIIARIIARIDTIGRYALYFTSDKVIVAKVSLGTALVWWILCGASLLLATFHVFLLNILGVVIFGLGGLAFLGVWRLQERNRPKKVKQLGELPPELILSADRRNIAITYAEIVRVGLVKQPSSVTISTGKTRREFLPRDAREKEMESYFFTLRSVLGDKVILLDKKPTAPGQVGGFTQQTRY